MAYVVTGLALWHAASLARHADDERVVTSGIVLALAILAQAALGIWTLLAVVPISLAVVLQSFTSEGDPFPGFKRRLRGYAYDATHEAMNSLIIVLPRSIGPCPSAAQA